MRPDIRVLSVHLACGGIRGPRGRIHEDATRPLPTQWQSCQCEEVPERWPGCDVSRDYELCTLCLRGTAGGTLRWAWHACATCREVNDAFGAVLGRRPLALGRHSIMNAAAVPIHASPHAVARAAAAFRGVVGDWVALRNWHERELHRLAADSGWPPDSDVPLTEWQCRYPPSLQVSNDAFQRLTGVDPCIGLPQDVR